MTLPSHQHLLGIGQLDRAWVERLLARAGEKREQLDGGACEKTLDGRVVVTAFFEDSTRTRLSFEVAAARLGASVVTFSARTSSVSKGETLTDTVRTLDEMGADYIVIRHRSVGAAGVVARGARAHVINGGDGAHEHPTQALLDALTMQREFGSVEGLNVSVVGDVLRSRVARSLLGVMKLLGAEVTLVGPGALVPREFESLGVKVSRDLREGIAGADVVYALRVQHERGGGSGALTQGAGAYGRDFGINQQRMEWASSRAVLMHPGPMNRGVEVSGALADDGSGVSRVGEQVRNGVAVRMAVMETLGERDG